MSKITHEEAISDLQYIFELAYSSYEFGDTVQSERLLKYIKQQEEKDNELALANTKLAMYEDLLDNLNLMNFRDSDLSRIEDTRNKIKLLDKKCDGECGI